MPSASKPKHRLRRLYCPHAVVQREGKESAPETLADGLAAFGERTEWSFHFQGTQLIAVNGDTAEAETYALVFSAFPASGDRP